MNTVLHKNIT